MAKNVREKFNQVTCLKTSALARSMDEAIDSSAAFPSINHWAKLPSSASPLVGANELKRWGWHQLSERFNSTALIADTQSRTLALLVVLIFMLLFPLETFWPIKARRWN